MPVKLGKDSNGCYAKWGDKGHKYYYTCGSAISRERARRKAFAQGVAIGEYNYEGSKVSFDYDGTLTLKKYQDIAKKLIEDGVDVYIISASHTKQRMLKVANELGIDRSNIFALGSNSSKIEKIKDLKIIKHYDNNKEVIDELGIVGVLVELNAEEKHKHLLNVLKNNKSIF